ncbi:MAG: YdcH family protein [Caulobacter sp.]
MALEARIRELDSRHRKLDRTIEEELNHPASDELRISELKRQKLRLKEEIEGLKARSH